MKAIPYAAESVVREWAQKIVDQRRKDGLCLYCGDPANLDLQYYCNDYHGDLYAGHVWHITKDGE